MLKRNTVVLIFMGMIGFSAQTIAQSYKIYDTRKQAVCDLAAIVDGAMESDVIFFGEEHNDSIGHTLQDALYKALLQKYSNVALSMEMFERDCQLVLDEYLAGYITEQQLIKEGRAWKNYKDYRNPVNTAKAHQQKVIAANAPRRYVNSVSHNGLTSLKNFPKDSRTYFAPLPIDTSNVAYAKKFRDLMQGHGSSNIYYAQCVWDATMANSIYTYWKKNSSQKVLHLNGRFHSDEWLGTVYQLQQQNKKLKTTTISSFSADDFENPDWEKYVHLADFVIVTDPAVPRSY